VFVAAVGVTIVSALDLDFIEAQLAQPSLAPGAAEAAKEPALTVTALLFAAAISGVVILAILVGRGFRLPAFRTLAFGPFGATPNSRSLEARSRLGSDRGLPETVSRAQGVADAVQRIGRREAMQDAVIGRNSEFSLATRGLAGGGVALGSSTAPGPSGRTYLRKRSLPQTASVGRRERAQ
jgi:hypothetical protein